MEYAQKVGVCIWSSCLKYWSASSCYSRILFLNEVSDDNRRGIRPQQSLKHKGSSRTVQKFCTL